MGWLELRCVELSKREDPFRLLTVADVRGLVNHNPDLYWGTDPDGPLPIKNSDGSFTTFPPQEGFGFVYRPEIFCICYEHDGGVTIHTNGDTLAEAKCRAFAEALHAIVFA
ncbi:MAG: hypothetical protein ACRC8S_23305 [Fimbriiglobus sp.]